ncbi:hypothetical protein JBL43_02935 [Aureibaculum sp. A20]|uniref:DUF4296 domain-containing protein n=1 Tax=Aureibaculum flavum TaxID=2795986 RepID=A0ABS0WMI5_9FLAO|nr:hypothetical protein [Aureibaculum flavum]MBJ2173178.1 hypothetical protein [Aureibaculum flavum]
MRNILLVTSLFFTCFIFAQKENEVEDDLNVPKSIFALNSFEYLKNNNDISSLQLTGYKFLIADNNYQSSFFYRNLHLDVRNFGRYASYEDIADNYAKASFYKYDVGKNSDHFIWNMWDTSIQKQAQKAKN